MIFDNTGQPAQARWIELATSATKLVTEVVGIRLGQNVVITADTKSDIRAVDASVQAVYMVEARPTAIFYSANQFPCMDLPPPAASAVAVADVWMEFSTLYSLYSKTFWRAIDSGCQYICLSGMTADMMIRTIGQADYQAMGALGRRLHKISQEAKSIRITSPAGTDISICVNPEISPFDSAPEPGKGFAMMLGGQASFNTYADSFEGTVVLDGTVWPPEEIGVPHSPINLTVRKGKITQVDGGREASIFRSWLESFAHSGMLMLDHICYGFNPNVRRLSGRILEDERLFGSVEFGIGQVQSGAPTHSDGVALSPSVWVDGIQIENQGIYLDSEVIEICRRMQVPGY